MDYTEIISAVIALISALVSAFLIPWIKERVGADKLKKWQAYVEIAVRAAEQLYNANEGAEKKAYSRRCKLQGLLHCTGLVRCGNHFLGSAARR